MSLCISCTTSVDLISVHFCLITAPAAGGDGWDQARAPVAPEGVAPAPVAATGWDAAAQPAPQGWE
jgi:hypothetical protein